MDMYERFIGKVVATRGIGSGVNVGRCAAIKGVDVLLEAGSFFMRSWTYKTSYGAFHSLSKVDVQGGEITLVKNDTIITDVAQCVICDDEILDVLTKLAK